MTYVASQRLTGHSQERRHLNRAPGDNQQWPKQELPRSRPDNNSKNLQKSVMSYNAVCSRIVTIRIKVRTANMSIIQIYAPPLDKDDEGSR